MSSVEGLDSWAEIGGRILFNHSAAQAQEDLDAWIRGVAAWIAAVAPNTGIQAAWYAEEPFILNAAQPDKTHARARHRLAWLTRLPEEIRRKERSPLLAQTLAGVRSVPAGGTGSVTATYVSPERITQLRHPTKPAFSTAKLVRLCEELNAAMVSKSYLSAIMLQRAILDHVPPIFGCSNFDQVVSQTNGRSFQPQLKRLNDQAKDVANRYLHEHIRATEALPEQPQVDFHSELDALLGEVVALLKP